MGIESVHERLEVLFCSQLDTYECRTEVLVGLANILNVNEVVCRSDHVADEREDGS